MATIAEFQSLLGGLLAENNETRASVSTLFACLNMVSSSLPCPSVCAPQAETFYDKLVHSDPRQVCLPQCNAALNGL